MRMGIATREKRAVEKEWAGCVYCAARGERESNSRGGVHEQHSTHLATWNSLTSTRTVKNYFNLRINLFISADISQGSITPAEIY